MERAGRKKLLLTGFISIAVCNLLMTIADSVLVRSPWRHDTQGLNLGNVTSGFSMHVTAPGPRAAQPAGPAGLLPDLGL